MHFDLAPWAMPSLRLICHVPTHLEINAANPMVVSL